MYEHEPVTLTQDIEVGKPVRPQLALRVSNAAAAWKKVYLCFEFRRMPVKKKNCLLETPRFGFGSI